MNMELDYLKKKWQRARMVVQQKPLPVESVIKLAEQKRKNNLYFHYGNIAVLSGVLIMIWLCFHFLFPFRETLSKTGTGLMMGGLALRILIEIFSTTRSRKIDLSETALKTTASTLEFYRFRKKIHGPVTYIIVALYTLGFYMLTPEFAKYIDTVWMAVIDCSYIPGAIILVHNIGKGIKKEMEELRSIIALQKEMNSVE
jgi:hypothetical protein